MKKVTQSGLSGRRPGHPLPAGDQGQPEGNDAHRRQAADPVRGRGGGRGRHHRHDLRHRPLQARHRGSLRQGLRTGERTGSARQERDARIRAQHAARRTSTASTSARPRRSAWAMPCCAPSRWSATSPSPCCWPTTCSTADPPVMKQMVDAFDYYHCSVLGVQDVPRADTAQLRHRRCPAAGRARRAGLRHRREAEARRCAVDAGRGRSLRADAAHLPSSGERQAGFGRRDPADRRHRLAARRGAGAGLPLRRHALRLRLQARLSAGDRGFRPPPSGSRARLSPNI